MVVSVPQANEISGPKSTDGLLIVTVTVSVLTPPIQLPVIEAI